MPPFAPVSYFVAGWGKRMSESATASPDVMPVESKTASTMFPPDALEFSTHSLAETLFR